MRYTKAARVSVLALVLGLAASADTFVYSLSSDQGGFWDGYLSGTFTVTGTSGESLADVLFSSGTHISVTYSSSANAFNETWSVTGNELLGATLPTDFTGTLDSGEILPSGASSHDFVISTPFSNRSDGDRDILYFYTESPT